jgi:hypothetical protein
LPLRVVGARRGVSASQAPLLLRQRDQPLDVGREVGVPLLQPEKMTDVGTVLLPFCTS